MPVTHAAVLSASLPRYAVTAAAWRPLRGPFLRWPNLSDSLLAALSFALTLSIWFQGAGADTMSRPIGIAIFLCAFVGNFALLWRRRRPLHVHAIVLGTSALAFLIGMTDGIFGLTFSLYSLGRYEANDRASLIGMLAALAYILVDLFLLSAYDVGNVIAASLVVLLWYVGRRMRFRGEYLRLLEERAEHLDRERSVEAERAVTEERTRIARELHDIVAHQVSLMTVQAGAAKTVARSDPRAAVDAMGSVEKAGRDALAEMRHLLSVLRPARAADDLGPQPGIADLPRLVREVSGAGPDVSLQTEGALSGLPARLDLTVYRIVQEALTNVLKHSGTGVRAEVMVRVVGGGIEVIVRDDGRAGNPAMRSGVIAGAALAPRSPATSGHGIAGMRERAELVGGTLSAGAVPGGGFEVRAVLPVGAGPTGAGA